MSDKPGRTGHDPYAAFRSRDFTLYILGSFLVQIGLGAQSVAIGWEIYARTDNTFALGLTGLVQAMPMILLTLPAGLLADAFSRRVLIMLSMAGSTVTSVCLAVSSLQGAPVSVMYLILLLDASIMTMARPARSAFLPLLVPRRDFENAVSWRMSIMHISAVAGPAIGGFLVTLGPHVVYLSNAGTTAVYVGFLALLKVKQERASSRAMTMQNVVAGARFVWRQPLLLTMISLDLFAVLLGGAVYLLPVFARDVLAAGERGLGWLRAAPAVGAFCVATLLAYLPPMKRAGRNLLLAVGGFGVATIVFGLSRVFWLSWAMLFLTGLFDNISMVIRHTMQQLLTPDDMRGRVSAMTSIFIGSSNELGGFESGLVARLFTPVISVVSGGIGTLIVVTTTAVASRRLRRFGSMSDIRTAVESPASSTDPESSKDGSSKPGAER